jgi:hypothetical protein
MVWGPMLWTFLHMVSLNYPMEPTPETKNNYQQFIKSLAHVLPCRSCRDNMQKHLKCLPLDESALGNRHNFAEWVFGLHNSINQSLGKTAYPGKFNDMKDCYETLRSGDGQDPNPICSAIYVGPAKRVEQVGNKVFFDPRCAPSSDTKKKKGPSVPRCSQ